MDKLNHMDDMLGNVLALFSRYGIRSVTMDDISRELGVSKKTLYQQVSDKNDLINRVIDHEMILRGETMDKLANTYTNAIDELIQVNGQIHSTMSSHNPTFYYDLRKYAPDVFKRWMEHRRRTMYDLIIQNMRKGKKEGLYRSDLDEHIIARLYMARMEMLSDNEIIKDQESVSLKFIREIFIYHLHGICNAEGLKYLALQKDRI